MNDRICPICGQYIVTYGGEECVVVLLSDEDVDYEPHECEGEE